MLNIFLLSILSYYKYIIEYNDLKIMYIIIISNIIKIKIINFISNIENNIQFEIIFVVVVEITPRDKEVTVL